MDTTTRSTEHEGWRKERLNGRYNDNFAICHLIKYTKNTNFMKGRKLYRCPTSGTHK